MEHFMNEWNRKKKYFQAFKNVVIFHEDESEEIMK